VAAEEAQRSNEKLQREKEAQYQKTLEQGTAQFKVLAQQILEDREKKLKEDGTNPLSTLVTQLKQEINNKISLGIGEDGRFAHKTGEYFEMANHDMGIVYMNGHHDYSICCFSAESSFDKALFNMRDISEIVYNYFETT
jgi:beta-lactamase class A